MHSIDTVENILLLKHVYICKLLTFSELKKAGLLVSVVAFYCITGRLTMCVNATVWRFVLNQCRSGNATIHSVFFPSLSHKGHDFQNKFIAHKMCALIFLRPFSETFLILRRVRNVIVINLHKSSCKISVIPVRFS